MQLIEELSTEIRTLSYLLHPPLLDESGLASALSWYTEGLAARSKIAVDLQVSPEARKNASGFGDGDISRSCRNA